ncbi:MAG: Spy/CpxP family protein refolding chaperone [Acidobacteriota bacterium]
MKKIFLILALILISVLFIYNFSFAQRYYRNARTDGYLYGLDLTDKQIQEINRLEIQLEKELIPLNSELRTLYIKLDELEMQRSPSMEEIDKVIEKIYKVEDQIFEKENQFNEKIRNLLTDEQKSMFDSTYGYGGYGAYLGLGLGGFGWNPGRGMRNYYGQGRYYNRYGQRYGYGRGLCRGIGYGWRLGGGYGYGRGIGRGRFLDYRYNRRRFRW